MLIVPEQGVAAYPAKLRGKVDFNFVLIPFFSRVPLTGSLRREIVRQSLVHTPVEYALKEMEVWDHSGSETEKVRSNVRHYPILIHVPPPSSYFPTVIAGSNFGVLSLDT